MGALGTELPTETAEKLGIPPPRGTISGTLADDPATNRQAIDPDLIEVARAWADLSATVRAGILAMVRAAKR
jgi:hypothetical protein